MKSSRKNLYKILLAVVVLLMVSLACGGTSGDDQSSGKVEVKSFKLLSDDGMGEPGEEVASFTPTDRIQHFEVNLNKMLKKDTVVKWVFTAVDTTAGKDIYITEVDTTVLIGNILSAQLEMDQDWPTGSYKAEVFIDGTLLQVFEYTVQ